MTMSSSDSERMNVVSLATFALPRPVQVFRLSRTTKTYAKVPRTHPIALRQRLKPSRCERADNKQMLTEDQARTDESRQPRCELFSTGEREREREMRGRDEERAAE